LTAAAASHSKALRAKKNMGIRHKGTHSTAPKQEIVTSTLRRPVVRSARPQLRQPRLSSDLAEICGTEKLPVAVAGIRSDAF